MKSKFKKKKINSRFFQRHGTYFEPSVEKDNLPNVKNMKCIDDILQ